MDKVESALQWGAMGALSCGGFLYGLAALCGNDVRDLATLPVVHELSDIHQVEKTFGLRNRRVAATGIATSKQPLTDTISRRPALVALVKGYETHRTRVRHGWEEGERPIKELRRSAPLSLELKNKQAIELKPADPREMSGVLEHAVTVSHPPRSNLLQQMFDNSLGYVITGSAEKEYILPPDTEITAIGEICREDGVCGPSYSLQPCQGQLSVSRKSIAVQITQMESWNRFLRKTSLCLGATGLLCAGIVVGMKMYKVYRRRKRQRHEKEYIQKQMERLEARRATGQEPENSPRPSPHQWHCNICWEEDVEQTVFPACGHIAVCVNCARHVSKCPVCRTVSMPRQIYYS